jgi:hypothetical protein
LRQYEYGCGIHYAWNDFPAHLIRRQHAPVHQSQVIVVGNLDVNADSAHAIGSFGSHGRLLPLSDECL